MSDRVLFAYHLHLKQLRFDKKELKTVLVLLKEVKVVLTCYKDLRIGFKLLCYYSPTSFVSGVECETLTFYLSSRKIPRTNG